MKNVKYIFLGLFLSFTLPTAAAHAYPMIQAEYFEFSGCGDFCVGIGNPYNEFRTPVGNTGIFQSGDTGPASFATLPEAIEDAQEKCDANEGASGSGSSSVVEFPPNGFVPTYSTTGYYWFAINMQGSGRCVASFAYYDGDVTPVPPTPDFNPNYTRIFSRVSPILSPIGTTTVPFEFNYVVGTDDLGTQVAQVCVRRNNVTSIANLPDICSPATSTPGYYTFATTTLMVDGFTYDWKPDIRDSNGDSLIPDYQISQETWFNFYITTAPDIDIWEYWEDNATTSTSTVGELTVQCNPEDGFFQNSICNMAVWLFVPSGTALTKFVQFEQTIPEKFPFSYFYAIGTAVQNAETSSSTNQFGQFTLDLTDTVIASQISILSTTTVNSFLGDSNRQWIREAIAYVLWLAFALMAFFTVRALFGKIA